VSTPEEAKAVVRRWNEEAWSGGNYDLAYEIISPDMTVHGAGGQKVGMGPDALIELIRTWRNAFPDGYMTIEDLIVEGDLVGVRNSWHGTHTGSDFYGIPASGKRVDVTSIGLDRVVDGKVVEGWGEMDMVGMMQQLGAMPLVGPGSVSSGKPPAWAAPVDEGVSAADAAEAKRVLTAFIEALAAGDRSAAEGLVAPDFVDDNPSWGTTDFDGALETMAQLRAAMPDLTAEIQQDTLLADSGRAESHTLYRGTHTGAGLYGVAASGTPVVWTQHDIVQVSGGRITRRWVSADTLSFLTQLGALPSAGG
jgi:predicted ester cyclase